MIETITKTHRGFKMALYLNPDDSFMADRPSYDYAVTTPTGVKFIGTQFRPAPSDLKNKVKILDSLLVWITLKPGDTDKEYFDSYTPEQMAWSQSFACEMAQSDLPED